MRLFLISFFLIYGSFHLYFFLKARSAFRFSAWTGVWLGLFMLFMVSAPALVRFTETTGYEELALVLAYAGHTWFALIFLFISSALLLDLFRLLVYSLDVLLQKKTFLPHISPLASFVIPSVFAIGIATYGYFEALDIRTEQVTIKTAKIPSEIGRIRLVQISDVHLGLIVREERLERIISAVRNAAPDILVSTGDLVDGQIASMDGLSGLFGNLHPRYGKFAVTGNHEFYAGIDQSVAFTEKAGFRVLRGESAIINGILSIAGIDDRTAKRFGLSKKVTEKELLSSLDKNTYRILLKHRPKIDAESLGLFDLQLSGHTHKGQIFPFSIVTWLYYPVHAGCLNPVDHCHIYVSRGTGTWGPPIRFLSPPEITVIDLVHDD